MNWRRGLGLCLLLLVAAGCSTAGRASHPVESAPTAAATAAVTDNAVTEVGAAGRDATGEIHQPGIAVMESIQVAGDEAAGESVRVEIRSSTSVDYTSYEPDLRRFILEIPNVDLSALPDELVIGEKGVSKAVITELPSQGRGSHARIEFIAEGLLTSRVVPQGRTLAVVLTADTSTTFIGDVDDAAATPAGPAEARPVAVPATVPTVSYEAGEDLPVAEPMPAGPADQLSFPASAVTGVVTESGGPGASIAIIGDGTLEHRAFALEDPHRVVVDLLGVINGVPEKTIELGKEPVSRVRIAQFQSSPEPIVRVVLDVTRKVDYEIVSDDYGLRVLLEEEAWAYRSEPESEDEPSLAASLRAADIPAPSQPAVREAYLEAPASGEPAGSDESPLIEISSPSEAPPRTWTDDDAQVPDAPAENQAVQEVAVEESGSTVQALPELEPRAVPSAPSDLDRDVILFDRSDPAGERSTLMTPEGTTFQSQTISTGEKRYRGEKISVTFRDADIREVFFFFGDLMKMNLVLDPDVSGRIDIRLRQVPWDQAFYVILKNQSLDAIEEDNVIRIAKTSKLRQEAAERRALKLAQEQEVDPITFTRRLSYAKVNEAMAVLSQVKSDRGKIIADTRTNTIIIVDIPSKRTEYENLIDALDLQTPQVSIEARIVEATRDFQRTLGITWGLTASADPALGTQTNLTFPHRANLNADVNLASRTNAGTLGIALGNVLDSITLDVTLDALEADGKVRILSAPRIVTQNNQAANIEQGTQIPVVTTTATEIEVQYVPASLRLEVTPQITAEETVIMKVIVTNDQPSDTLSVGDTPAIITERVDTQILVRSGTTAVIGGVFKLSESESETGLPGLRRIPFLGWLFKNKEFVKSSAELLVFLTPKIITTI